MIALLDRLNNWPYLLLAGTALAWGGNAIAGQLARDHISPGMLVFLRWVLVAALMAALYGRQLMGQWPTIRANLAYIVAMAAIGFTGFNTLFYIASTKTSGVNIGIIQGSIPIVVLIGAFFAYRTHVRVGQALGAGITTIGVIVVATTGSLERFLGLEFNSGDMLMGLACVLYGGYTVGLQRRPPMPAMLFFATLAFVALATSLPFAIWELSNDQAILPDLQGWLVALFVAVFPSFLAQIWFMRGVELIGPGRAGLFVNLVPVFAAILAILILDERFQLYHAVALAAVLGGIALAEAVKRAER